jgi:putative peptidoglycan lipid II flippase
MSEKRKIAEATLVIGIFAILGKVLGFVREILTAAYFGTSFRADAYFIGMAGPDFIREVISGGVLTAVFIPVYTSCAAGANNDEKEKLLNTTATILILALVATAFLGFPLAPFIVKIIAPEIDAQTFNLAVDITRIIFPAMIFMGLASFYGSLLNVYRHFITPSLSQLMLNIGVISGVVALSSRYGVKSLAIGFIAGALLQLLVILPSLKNKAVSCRFELIMTPALKKMFLLWVPLFVASFVSTANDLVSRSMAAGIGEGNVAAITFANRIRETIWLLCAVPLGTAVFPFLSDYAARKDLKELEKMLSFSIRLTSFLALPMCLVMLFYSEPIVKILFQRGQFNVNSTLLTSSALLYYSVGALFPALSYVILKVYYSLQDSKTPLVVFSITLVLNIAAGLLLRKGMLVGGVALARSISDFAAFFLLMYFLTTKFPELNFGVTARNILKITIIALLSLAVSYVVYIIVPARVFERNYFVKLGAALTVFTLVYVGVSLSAGIEEMQSIKRMILRKFE